MHVQLLKQLGLCLVLPLATDTLVCQHQILWSSRILRQLKLPARQIAATAKYSKFSKYECHLQPQCQEMRNSWRPAWGVGWDRHPHTSQLWNTMKSPALCVLGLHTANPAVPMAACENPEMPYGTCFPHCWDFRSSQHFKDGSLVPFSPTQTWCFSSSAAFGHSRR